MALSAPRTRAERAALERRLERGRGAPRTPAGLAPRLLELADELRREGMAVGTSELLDAFGALTAVSWTDREDFREALSATIAKSQEDRRVLELVFDRFFFRAAEREALAREVTERAGEAHPDVPIDLEALRGRIRQALCAPQDPGGDGQLRDLARLAISAFGRQSEGCGVIGVDVQRIRRALGLKGAQRAWRMRSRKTSRSIGTSA